MRCCLGRTGSAVRLAARGSGAALACLVSHRGISAAMRTFISSHHTLSPLRLHCTALCTRSSYAGKSALTSQLRCAASTVAASPDVEAAVPKVCLLCDVRFTEWQAHCQDPAHIARTAVCRYFVLPKQGESLMDHLERHVALDVREVDALTARKVGRRRRRLLAGLLHLQEEGVLTDALPCHTSSSSNSSSSSAASAVDAALQVHPDRFLTRLLLGEAFMRREVLDRTAQLVPTLTEGELSALTGYLMTSQQLARLFDELALQELLRTVTEQAISAAEEERLKEMEGKAVVAETASAEASTAAPLPRLTREEKAAVLLSCLGALEHFHRQDRPRSVLSKVAADAVVLNVIATHARDNIVSELVHEALQRIVEEGSPVWWQHQKEVLHRAARGVTEEQATGLAVGRHQRSLRGSAPTTVNSSGSSAAPGPLVRHLQHTPLSTTPTPAPPAMSAVLRQLDDAAAEEMVAAYVVLADVDESHGADEEALAAVSDGGATASPVRTRESAGGSLVPPFFASAEHLAKTQWEPVKRDLEKGAAFHRQLPWTSLQPRMHFNMKSDM